jgi:hypothetical protein
MAYLDGKWIVEPGLYAIRSSGARKDRPACVYVIGSDEQPGLVKIGIATNVELRVAELQTANPFPLKVITTKEYSSKTQARSVEAGLHRLYSAERVSGEWFRIADVQALADFVKGIPPEEY